MGASTDRLAGTLDIEKALSEGRKAFEPGLLAAAHRGILYVDEVNLLSDHLVDLLLDVAAMGVNHVEREGVSVRHPSRFILVGTMNPEEGELRPQLLDRFGVTVEVSGKPDPARQGRGRQAQAPLRGRPRGVLQRMVERGREAAQHRGIGPRRASRRRPGRGDRCSGSRPCAPTSAWTACAATWLPRRPHARWPPGTPGTRSLIERREAGRAARPLAPPQARPLRADRHRPRGAGERSSPKTPTRRTARTAAPHRLSEDERSRFQQREDPEPSEARTGAGERSHAASEPFEPCAPRGRREGQGRTARSQEPHRRARPGILSADREAGENPEGRGAGRDGEGCGAAPEGAGPGGARARGSCRRSAPERQGGQGGEPDPLPRRRERLDGGPQTHVRRQGRRTLPA